MMVIHSDLNSDNNKIGANNNHNNNSNTNNNDNSKILIIQK